jgi:FSR family fosmidomycin resistance protein-like MFS transporter
MNRNKVFNLFFYSILHALIDAAGVFLILFLIRQYDFPLETKVGLILLYNACAFALQTVFGLLSDHFRAPRLAAALGCLLMILGLAFGAFNPLAAIIAAGIGNALFHVGAGSIALNITPKRAMAIGIFVAPGAIGLALGTTFGKMGFFPLWPIGIALFLSLIVIWQLKSPKMDYERRPVKINKQAWALILALLFGAIALRALVGSVAAMPWKKDLTLLFVVVAAIAIGKALGAIFADRFGWRRVAVGALILAAPLLAFGATIPILGIVGAFLFQIPMAVTLVAISNLLPGRPGFAFGLNCLALVLGAWIVFSPAKSFFVSPTIIFVSILAAAVLIFFGLKSDNRK